MGMQGLVKKGTLLRWIAALVGVGIAAAVFPACSNIAYKLAYQSADRLLLNRVDSYFDPTPEQRSFLEKRIAEHLAWHRAEELPRYATSLSLLKTRALEGVTPAKTDWFFAETDDAWKRTFARLFPDFAAFLATLSDAQIDRFYNRMQKENAELEEYLALPADKRAAEREKKTLTFIEDWCGTLNDAQRAKVHEMAPSIPDTNASRLAYRKLRQAEFIALLRSRPGAPAIEKKLRQLFLSGDAGYPPGYRAELVQWRGAMKAFIIEMDKTLTAEQRQRAAGKIDNLAATALSLHNEIASSSRACTVGC
ncbi:MAG: hypothetical protein HY042_10850 [Spirochaetia bacterium]|nr:hypothetical protein [Spirochaetia bacterium]